MPANVTAEYDKARMQYEQANTPETKLAALLEMQRFAPSHKGGENLRRDISKKIAAARKEIDKKKKQEKKGKGISLAVPKEGIGQIALVGVPNSGKSTLLKALTGVDVEIAPYEFTTTKPVVGMLDYHGGKIQLVEIPAIVEGSSRGKFNGLQLFAVIRNADAIILVVRNDDEKKTLVAEFEKAGIIVTREKPRVKILTGGYKGISIAGKQFLKCSEKELLEYLKGVGILHASIVLNEPTDLSLISMALNDSIAYKKFLAVSPFTELNAGNLEGLKRKIFELLDKVLVYTKKPGREVDYKEPLALPRGATVEEAAKQLHKDFEKMKYARLWGSSRYEGQRVPKEYVLQNFDVLEIYC